MSASKSAIPLSLFAESMLCKTIFSIAQTRKFSAPRVESCSSEGKARSITTKIKHEGEAEKVGISFKLAKDEVISLTGDDKPR